MNYQQLFYKKYYFPLILLDIILVLYLYVPSEKQLEDNFVADIPKNTSESKESTVPDIIWPISTFLLTRDFHVDRDFAVLANGAQVINSSETWDRAAEISYFWGIPLMYDIVYTATTLIRKNRPLKREKCWIMAVKSKKNGFFEIHFGKPINISFVRYEHHEINSQKDELTVPIKFKVYAVNSNGFLTFLTEFKFSLNSKLKVVPVNEIQFKTSRIKVEIVENGGSHDFTRLCKFYVYGKV